MPADQAHENAVEKSDGKGGRTHVSQSDINEALHRNSSALRGRSIEQTQSPTCHNQPSTRDPSDSFHRLQKVAKIIQFSRDLGYENIEELLADLRDAWTAYEASREIQLPSSTQTQQDPVLRNHADTEGHVEVITESLGPPEVASAAAELTESSTSAASVPPTSRQSREVASSHANVDHASVVPARKRTATSHSDNAVSSYKRLKRSGPASQNIDTDPTSSLHETLIKTEDTPRSPRPWQYPVTLIESSIVYPDEEEGQDVSSAGSNDQPQTSVQEQASGAEHAIATECIDRRRPSVKGEEEPDRSQLSVPINVLRRPVVPFRWWSCNERLWEYYTSSGSQTTLSNYSIAGYIMETDAGTLRKSGPCSDCEIRGKTADGQWFFECKVLSDSARELANEHGIDSDMCAFCRVQGHRPGSCARSMWRP